MSRVELTGHSWGKAGGCVGVNHGCEDGGASDEGHASELLPTGPLYNLPCEAVTGPYACEHVTGRSLATFSACETNRAEFGNLATCWSDGVKKVPETVNFVVTLVLDIERNGRSSVEVGPAWAACEQCWQGERWMNAAY
uniref:Uncharacterized protein n=1 Tax=Cacopsylla melanoneura TaxID=428564 RepID=A0A8D9ALY9_9HEMI